MNSELIFDQAKAEGSTLGSLVVAGGLEFLAPDVADGVSKVLRAMALVSVAMRQADLAEAGATEAQQDTYRQLSMEVFDSIVSGWLERCRFVGRVN